MKTLVLNIGLKQGNTYPAHAARNALATIKEFLLPEHGDKLLSAALANSNSERTLIATIETDTAHWLALALCKALNQEDAAFTEDGTGYMATYSWGHFNPEQFLITGKDITACY